MSGRDASAVRDSAERPAAARAGDGRDTRDCAGTITLGIYEKALRGNELATRADWEAFLAQVPEAGFSFVDMSVDESPRREARLAQLLLDTASSSFLHDIVSFGAGNGFMRIIDLGRQVFPHRSSGTALRL